MDVFNYSDYRTLLRDFYSEQKQKQTSFSYRAFANRAKLASPNYLKLVIEGSRRITDRNISQFLRGLKLSGWEAEYFKRLVEFQNATDPDLQRHYLGELDSIKLKANREIRELSGMQLEVLKHWRHWAIRELVLLNDFTDDPVWIANRLKFSVTPAEAAESLELLKRLKFIEKVDGHYQQIDPVLGSSDDVPSRLVREFHKQMIDLGKVSLDEDALERREIGGVTLAVSEQSIHDISLQIKRFLRELVRVYSTDTGNTEVYHLVMNFFPITQHGRGVLQ